MMRMRMIFNNSEVGVAIYIVKASKISPCVDTALGKKGSLIHQGSDRIYLPVTIGCRPYDLALG